MKTPILLILTLILLAIVLSGCIGQPPQKGGHAKARGAELQQPQNPAGPSSQNIEDEDTMEYPAGTAISKLDRTYDDHGQMKTENRTITTLPQPAKQTTHSHVAQTIGASQQDSSRNLTVKYQAMRPVLYASIIFFIAAGLFAYLGWWTKAGIMAGIGILMLVLAAVIPGHEWVILGGGLIVAIIAIFVVLYVYYKGHHDAIMNLPGRAGTLVAGLEAKIGGAPAATAPTVTLK